MLGIDPGGRSVGAIARLHVAGAVDELLAHQVFDLASASDRTLHRDVVRRVARRVDEQVLEPALRSLAAAGITADLAVAIEALRPPGGFADGQRRPLNPRDPMGVALVLGALLGYAWPVDDHDLVLVAPTHNGRGALASYPPALVSAAEARQGLNRPAGQSSALRHVRSAWDVAGMALRTARHHTEPALT